MVAEVAQRDQATFLPEQYYLADRFTGWRHIDQTWNWEVWPEWDDPKKTHPTSEARDEVMRQGWARDYMRPPREPGAVCELSCAGEVLAGSLVWHFSGTGETAPWMFMDLR